MIERLNKHHILGLDLDKTLINHPNSYLLHDYIKAHPDKRFWIITHRSHDLVPQIWPDIERTILDRSDFEGFKAIPDEMYEAYARAETQRRAGIITGELTASEKAYFSWKGMTCHQLGCTVLVDDKPSLNQLGMDRYGIELIDINDL